jgi:hypothetical protein
VVAAVIWPALLLALAFIFVVDSAVLWQANPNTVATQIVKAIESFVITCPFLLKNFSRACFCLATNVPAILAISMQLPWPKLSPPEAIAKKTVCNSSTGLVARVRKQNGSRWSRKTARV